MPQYGFDPNIIGQAQANKARVNALNQQTDFRAEEQEAKRQQAMAAQQQAQLMNQLDLSQPYETQTEIISQLPQETQQGLLKFYQETPADLRARKQAIKTASQEFIKNTYGSVKDQASYDRMRTQLPMFLHGSGAKPEEIREVLQMVPREYDKDRVLMEWAAVGGPQNALEGSYTLSPGQKRIGAQGNVLAEGGEAPEKWGTPYKVVEDGVTRLKRRSSTGAIEDLGEGTKATGTTINLGSKGPMAAIKPILAKMPEMQQTAKSAAKNIERLDQALDLADKRGEDIAGWSGDLRRLLAKPAKAVGLNIKGMNEAEIFNSLLTEGQGALRMQVVGPGPVSEYEQKILEAVSGKRMSSIEGIKKILERSRENQTADIETYNSHIESLSGVEGMDIVGKLYKPVKIKERATVAQEGDIPEGAAFGGVNPETGLTEYFDEQGNRVE